MKAQLFILFLLCRFGLLAQFAPDADTEGSDAINKDSSIIVSWATGYENYIVGSDVDDTWQTPEKALGKANGLSGDIVCLGRGGQITFAFDTLIVNQAGPDFVTFENGFLNTFLELAWVEVSMDGVNFERFPNQSLTTSPVSAFGGIDPTKIYGYCSKYRQGFGTPFDLDSVQLDTIRYIRLLDIVGDGTALDSYGHVIYDPYPTTGSAGLDIDAIGVIHAGSLHEGIKEFSKNDFKIYPNPASESLTLILTKGEGIKDTQVYIYNITGKLVKSLTFGEKGKGLQIQISDLETGVYILKINTKNSSVNQKLMIKR